jgi:hypothetical protein
MAPVPRPATGRYGFGMSTAPAGCRSSAPAAPCTFTASRAAAAFPRPGYRGAAEHQGTCSPPGPRSPTGYRSWAGGICGWSWPSYAWHCNGRRPHRSRELRPALARPPRRRHLPEADQTTVRPQWPRQRIRTRCVEVESKAGGRVLEPYSLLVPSGRGGVSTVPILAIVREAPGRSRELHERYGPESASWPSPPSRPTPHYPGMWR